MRFITGLVVASVAGLAALANANSARADEVASATEQHATQAVYEGVDTDGRQIRLTISDAAGPKLLVRVDGRALPAQHWTSLIGTGTAASLER
jgi:hypothetical protein